MRQVAMKGCLQRGGGRFVQRSYTFKINMLEQDKEQKR